MDSLDVFLLVLQSFAVFEKHFRVHSRRVEGDFFALSHVDQSLANVFDAHFCDELSDLVVVHASSQGAKEIDGLTVELFNQAANVFLVNTVGLEDTVGDTNTIFKGRRPVKLLHSTGPGIEIVDEQSRQLTLLDDVGRLAITLTNQLGRLTGVTGFQFTSRHDNRRNAQLGEDQVRLESLTLTLTTPDAQD